MAAETSLEIITSPHPSVKEHSHAASISLAHASGHSTKHLRLSDIATEPTPPEDSEHGTSHMSQPYNLLFLFTDEQAASTMRAYGNDRIRCPALDRLADQSIVFRNAYVTQSVCTPSRSSIMTGQYPHTNGCVANDIPLRAETPCLNELGDFSAYRRAYMGKWHLGDEVFRQHGFDEWVSIDTYRNHWSAGRDRSANSDYAHWLMDQGFRPDARAPDGWETFSRGFCCRIPEQYSKPAFLAESVGRFLRDTAQQPWLLFVNFLEPHMPYYSCRDTQYDPADVPLPENFDALLTEDQPLKARLYARAYERFGHSGLPLRTDDDWRRLIANYWGLTSLVDTYVGRVLDELESTGQAERTIVVYTSDHGDMMGSHRLLAKCVQFEEALKVPLMIHMPDGRFGPPRQISHSVSQIDLVPTLLEALGQRVPHTGLDGYSLCDWLSGRAETPTEPDVFAEWNGWNTGILGESEQEIRERLSKHFPDVDVETALRHISAPIRTIITPDGWKYNHSGIGEDELYRLAEDRGERRNLAGDPAQRDRIADLRNRIQHWKMRTNDRSFGVQESRAQIA